MSTALDLRVSDDMLAIRSSTEQALVVDHVTKHFGGSRKLTLKRKKKSSKVVLAVDDVSLKVRRGEIYGILGANGSGKSTLIRLLATLLFPDSGTARIFGLDVVRQAAEVKRLINRVSVEASLFKKLSAMENLMYAARLYGLEPGQAKQDIITIMAGLGIPEKRVRQPVEKMSRGMQQKVAIARALLTSPVLLLLDEPTTGLDPRSKKDVEQFVLSLRSTHDATILLTSHDMHEADTLCDRLAIIDKGRIVVEGTPQELKDAHRLAHGLHEEPSLEDVFMEVTGRSLADDEEEDNEEDDENGDS